MHPIIADFSWVTIYSYPLFMGLAWGVGLRVIFYLIEKYGKDPRPNFIFFVLLFVSAWLGAKAFFLYYSAGENFVKYVGMSSFWFGGGFNYGENPIPDNKSTVSVAGGANTDGDTMNLFNYAMFPATIESAYTIGGGFSISKGMTVDLAYTYAPEVSDTVSAATVGVGDITTKHSQAAMTVALNFDF